MNQTLTQATLPEPVLAILKRFAASGHESYLVGGCTRDLLLGKTPQEWDLTTSATPYEMTQLFDRVIPTGIDHGTVTLLFPEGQYEVTTFRQEGSYEDARHPDHVTFTTDIHEDLKRRDFTMNAIAFNPLSGEIVDDFNGQTDIENKLIRTVGNPIDRFQEDGLRPLRACRFAAQLQFQLQDRTFHAISQALASAAKVAKERIQMEFMKLLAAPTPSHGIELMRLSHLLELLLPELTEGIGVEQNRFHAYDVYQHSVKTCDNLPAARPLIRLAGLLHDIGKPRCKQGEHFYGHEKVGRDMAEQLMKRLKFSERDTHIVCHLIKEHLFDYQPIWKDSTVRRFIRRIGKEQLPDLFMLREGDVGAMGRPTNLDSLEALKTRIAKILSESPPFSTRDLAINGTDIMTLKQIPPSKEVGSILHYLLEQVTEEPSWNTREKLAELTKAYPSS